MLPVLPVLSVLLRSTIALSTIRAEKSRMTATSVVAPRSTTVRSDACRRMTMREPYEAAERPLFGEHPFEARSEIFRPNPAL